MKLKEHLQERGYLYQYSSDDIFEKLEQWSEKFYVWFDPTADSLHMWNFIGFMTAVQLMLKWNKYYALVGGATGMVWDPGGKESERTFLDEATLEKNVAAIWNQFTTILTRLSENTGKKLDFEIVNNLDFYVWVSYLDFLREVWKFHTVNQMMSKDTVKKRIEDPTKSISYTEFSYMLLQGFDYYYLHKNMWVNLQMGGQDQWGNLVTGIELIRKKTEDETYVFTWPLITDASWKKFGKSEWNALFLDRNKTRPYAIYQYFMNTEDADVERYLKLLTLLDSEYIASILEEHSKSPEQRLGQKRLAYEVVKIIHWEEEAKLAANITEFLFGEWDKIELLTKLNADELKSFSTEIGWLIYSSQNLFELFIESRLEKSGGSARQSISSGALALNEQKITDTNYDFSNDFIHWKFLLIRKWKKNYRIILK